MEPRHRVLLADPNLDEKAPRKKLQIDMLRVTPVICGFLCPTMISVNI
jgi:hypothetical protein